MTKKLAKRIVAVIGIYWSYCFVRGFIYGFRNGHKADPEMAVKIATFRG